MIVKDALSVLPARPVLYIVPLIVVIVLSFYYWEQYSKCSNIKSFRTSLSETLRSRDDNDKFRLVDFTDFIWDKVRIVASVKPGERNVECPFGWNWASGERESLMTSGLLSVLMFGHGESIVGYIELRSDEVAFRDVDYSLTPQNAVFTVRPNLESGGAILTLKK
ncbi:MAG: hypothetical protein OEY09_02455 [Gammaproteobacteria bacterium]|nr:hypothetical protein [Gammaproteobacteria bacterium]